MVVIYTVSIVAVYPFAHNKEINKFGGCRNKWEKKYIFIIYCLWGLLAIFIPLCIIGWSQSQMFLTLKSKNQDLHYNEVAEKRRVKDLQKISRTFIMVLVGFFVCCIPYTIFAIFYTYTDAFNREYISKNRVGIVTCGKTTFALMTANCCLNPFIYGKTGCVVRKFIVHLRELNCRLSRRPNNPIELTSISKYRDQRM